MDVEETAGVDVGELVSDEEGVPLPLDVFVGLRVAENVVLGECVSAAVEVADAVIEADPDALGVPLPDEDDEDEPDGVPVCAGVTLRVSVLAPVPVRVVVEAGEPERVTVNEGVPVGMLLDVGVPVSNDVLDEVGELVTELAEDPVSVSVE